MRGGELERGVKAMFIWMGAWLLGVVLGFRHAFEPDHLTAVATLAAERRGRRATLWIGAIWGVGHTLSLLGVGGLLAMLERALPSRLESVFELGVAGMLCVLGGRSLRAAVREGASGIEHPHRHPGMMHPGSQAHVHVGRGVLSLRPLFIGLVHGLAGSGAMTALAMSAMPTAATRLAYVALFGVGSICGMAALTGLLGLPLRRLQQRPEAQRALQAGSGALALAFGCYWAVTSGAGAFR